MAVAVVIQLDANSFADAEAPNTAVEDTIQEAVRALKGVNPRPDFVLGSQLQDQNVIQITSEQDDLQNSVGNESALKFSPFLKSVRSLCGEPLNIFHVALNRPVFGPDGPAMARVVEFVLSYFPVSRVTPDFRKQVQDDFLRFDEIYSPAVTGSQSWASGWLLEDQMHESLNGEMAKCFLVVRGWDSMDHFEASIKSDAYKQAIPLLLAWNTPWKMWHVERRS
ncbi:hypothetical protein N7510_010510 [Penicillium lagena]|uniref:uncharacterized protein n=1 Tax=Penicillium lagena TaxID=94218 RepID=UPI0025425B51|nr:uncharacterized protein N7510_010510 [Penicillium lagena]KAJ5605356.1 hypothetical protein N7510_010510 [Penicillium lagena]